MDVADKFRVTAQSSELAGTVQPGGSKSISNRALIIRELSDQWFPIYNLANAADTGTLKTLLDSDKTTLDAGNAGTTLRFLTALLSCRNGEWTLTGSERMKERPVGILVSAMRKLGAEIHYLEQDGFPPLSIKGKTLKGGKLEIDASVSSQFVSALLLIAPTMQDGLTLNLKNKRVSETYIRMTIRLMKQFGIEVRQEDNSLVVPPQSYQAQSLTVEEDWSTASYFFEAAAFSSGADIKLQNLACNSLQGDERIGELMTPMGIDVYEEEDGLRIVKQEASIHFMSFNLKDVPDLAPALAVTCGGLGIEAMLTGLGHLKYKETNRLVALQNELAKIHCKMELGVEDTIELYPFTGYIASNFSFATYNDHRMAMAFAPLALPFHSVDIEQPDVVEKSCPHYWQEFQKLGFQIKRQPNA